MIFKNSRSRKTPARKATQSHSNSTAGQAKEEIYFGLGQSSLGHVLVASSKKGIVSILVGEDVHPLIEDLEQRFPKARIVQEDRDPEGMVARVVEYIEAPSRSLDLLLDLRGTAFRQRVWQAVRKIPAGQTSTYTEIARQIGAEKAMRAVGSACANNHLAIVIPCHRVLHKDGSLSGGSFWSDARQRELLDREAATKPHRKAR